jgi:hypothetical protein
MAANEMAASSLAFAFGVLMIALFGRSFMPRSSMTSSNLFLQNNESKFKKIKDTSKLHTRMKHLQGGRTPLSQAGEDLSEHVFWKEKEESPKPR